MIAYSEAKEALKKAGQKTTYFTKDFYNLYVEEYRSKFNKIFDTDFYNKNSCAYCEFLSIFNDSLPTFIIYGYIDAWQKEKIYTLSAEDEAMALKLVDCFADTYKHIEVIKQ